MATSQRSMARRWRNGCETKNGENWEETASALHEEWSRGTLRRGEWGCSAAPSCRLIGPEQRAPVSLHRRAGGVQLCIIVLGLSNPAGAPR